MIRILFLGDVVGQFGCDLVQRRLRTLKRQYGADIAIVNGENSAEGNGVLPSSARQLFDSGVDVITGGNHCLRRREIYSLMEEQPALLRPANLHPAAPGNGVYILDMMRYRLAVVSLQGVSFMEPIDNPFVCMDELLKKIDTPNIFVDFHAESTAEKLCLGWYLDGRVSAVIGTHTHVPTADERILPQGTAYLTDAGMCGGYNSVLGVKCGPAIERMRTRLPVRFENEKSDGVLYGAVIEIDEKTGRAQSITRICDRVE